MGVGGGKCGGGLGRDEWGWGGYGGRVGGIRGCVLARDTWSPDETYQHPETTTPRALTGTGGGISDLPNQTWKKNTARSTSYTCA